MKSVSMNAPERSLHHIALPEFCEQALIAGDWSAIESERPADAIVLRQWLAENWHLSCVGKKTGVHAIVPDFSYSEQPCVMFVFRDMIKTMFLRDKVIKTHLCKNTDPEAPDWVEATIVFDGNCEARVSFLADGSGAACAVRQKLLAIKKKYPRVRGVFQGFIER